MHVSTPRACTRAHLRRRCSLRLPLGRTRVADSRAAPRPRRGASQGDGGRSDERAVYAPRARHAGVRERGRAHRLHPAARGGAAPRGAADAEGRVFQRLRVENGLGWMDVTSAEDHRIYLGGVPSTEGNVFFVAEDGRLLERQFDQTRSNVGGLWSDHGSPDGIKLV